jgi:glyoxylate/hydroxypyruvate reductase A
MRVVVLSRAAGAALPLLMAARPDVEWVGAERVEELTVDTADAVFGAPLPAALFDKVGGIRWAQWWAAGVDQAGGVPRTVTLTRTVGVFTAGMAEYVLWCLLDWVKNGPTARRQQAEHRWARYRSRTLAGLVVGVAGAGAIGSGIGETVARFGARVWTLTTTPRPRPFAEQAFGADQTDAFLGGLDALVLVLPLTPATYHFLDAARLARLKPGAVLVNVGRGKLVDEAALRDSLEREQPAHAYLDVVETEPLPAESWLWDHPRVSLTPHLAGPNVLDEIVRFSLDNLARWERGDPLVGVVDRERGY